MDARGIIVAIGRVPVPWHRVPVPWPFRNWCGSHQPGDIKKLADIARADVHSIPEVVAPDVDRATADMLARLDIVTWSLGNLLLATPILPV
jgi:hypothetical protein